MTRSAIGSLLSATLLGAILAASAPAAPDQVTDSSVTSWVNEAVRHEEVVPASEISVSTQEGVVKLSVPVDKLAAKHRVDRQATKIRGVREVLNELTVAPSLLSDADIVYAIRRRILNNANIVSQGVVVTSVDGNVTIQGEVANWSEAEEAALLASGVAGVTNVKNDLVTRYEATRSDQEIKNDAVAALHRDVYLTGFPITVAVEDGVVSLTGSVGNAYQKRRAAQAARRVSHVTFVKNELVVRPEEKGELRESDVSGRVRGVCEVVDEIRVQPATGTIPQRSDATLAKEIRDSFRSHWATSRVADRIRVGVNNGVATLTGDLDTWGERYEAGRVAFDIEGVWWVQNRLTVEGYEYDWEKWEYEAPYDYYEEPFPNVA